MAKQVTVTMIDDFDKQSEAAETVQFAIDGVAYEIDLSLLNGAKLRGVLEPWMDKARKVGRVPRGKASRGSNGSGPAAGSRANREQMQVIREWAKQHGHQVSTRGRISAEVMEAYQGAAGS